MATNRSPSSRVTMAGQNRDALTRDDYSIPFRLFGKGPPVHRPVFHVPRRRDGKLLHGRSLARLVAEEVEKQVDRPLLILINPGIAVRDAGILGTPQGPQERVFRLGIQHGLG